MPLELLLDILYPRVCGFCGNFNQNFLCDDCKRKISDEVICKIEDVHDKYFEKLLCLSNYDGMCRSKLLEYKFSDKAYMYKSFAKIILDNEIICSFLNSYDIIVPVPIHRKRKNERGYNQSELIAKEISKGLTNVSYKKVLVKVKDNVKQSLLTMNERADNVKGAYNAMYCDIISGKRIILFDDVVTTGSTANECCKVLKSAGAKDILVCGLAH